MPVLAPRRLFTVEQFHQMADAAIFGADDRIELLSGEIVEMTPIGSRHAACVSRVNRLLGQSLGEGVIVRVQDPLRLDDYSEPQPDLGVVRDREDFYRDRHPGSERVLNPKGCRRRARSAARPKHMVSRRDGPAQRVRAVEGREACRLRHLAQRLRLAGVQRPGSHDKEAAEGQDRVGQGVRRGAATASTTAAIRTRRRARSSRRPTRTIWSTTTASAHRSPRTSSSTRIQRTRSVSAPCRRPKTSALRFSTFPIAARASRATPCS